MRALVEFVNRYEPAYAGIVRGVPEPKIAELEAALGRRLPGVYRDFLETVGENIGFDVGNASFDIDDVIALVTDRGEPIPERFIPIAEDTGTGWEDYFLDFQTPYGQDDALVVRISTGAPLLDEQRPIFWSFRDMIFSLAFESVAMIPLPERMQILWLAGDPDDGDPMLPTPDALKVVMTRLGFQALDLTSPAAQFYEREDCVASVYQVPFEPDLSLLIAARERKTAIHVAEIVRDALPQGAKLSDASR